MNVAILGASQDPKRFAYKAFLKLSQHGHKLFPVSPKMAKINDVPVFQKLTDISEPIDTVTMYVGPERSSLLLADIIDLKPRRVIFNPGSENREVEEALKQNNILVQRACTLILLDIDQF